MDPILVPVMALTIPIVAILGAVVVKPWMKMKERQLEMSSQLTAEKAAQYAAQTERLEQRVQVLERIITDGGHNLSLEIEKLRSEALPDRSFEPKKDVQA
jgi:type II secretory pathway pseudopilin PulG